MAKVRGFLQSLLKSIMKLISINFHNKKFANTDAAETLTLYCEKKPNLTYSTG